MTAAFARARDVQSARANTVVQRSARILFIADEGELVSIAGDAFAPAGWEVVVAKGAHDAMFVTHRNRFDVVVCGDLASACAVREFVSGRGTAVLVFVDRGRDPLPRDIRVTPKPRSADELRAAIEAVLQGQSARSK